MRDVIEPLILSVSGRDRPGVLATLAAVLAEEEIELVDIEQATLQEFLALSFLVDLNGRPGQARAVLSRFFPAATALGLAVEARPVSPEELRSLKEQDLWALTLLGATATAEVVATIAGVTSRHQCNIMSVRRLAEDDIRAAEFILDASRCTAVDAMRRDLFVEAERVGVDVGLSRASVYRQSKRIVVLDADSTLVAGEVIDELALLAGVADRVKEITRRAMEGKLDFAAALRERVALLRGLPVERLREVEERLPLTPGAEEMIAALRALGYKVGVISGGFTFFTDSLKRRLKLDYAFANELEIEDGRLTGHVVPPIVDAEGKAERLRSIAQWERVPLSQVVGVGDGANDIPMLQTAGLGVAFRAKEAAKRAADGAIHQESLLGLLYLLGVSQADLRDLAAKG
ncbi:MAG: phosphoserine phosphatase SerB [Candidatus Eisenbacteria bacterium]|nr:phosphoserine phosphatase SerB [Candidatus Eisenbacteria bacterium]